MSLVRIREDLCGRTPVNFASIQEMHVYKKIFPASSDDYWDPKAGPTVLSRETLGNMNVITFQLAMYCQLEFELRVCREPLLHMVWMDLLGQLTLLPRVRYEWALLGPGRVRTLP